LTAPTCYLFAGGGTGGHLTPGLAVALELAQSDPGCRILFVGTNRPLEEKLIAGAGYDHVALPVESSRTLRRNPMRFLWGNWQALRRSGAMLARECPTAVIGLGGYACVPAVFSAARRQIPTLVLEQNAIAGRATRLLSRRVDAVCTALDETRGTLPRMAHVVLTGNPVRPAIAELAKRTAGLGLAGPPTLLILGGSQGAESLNEAVVEMLATRPPALSGWRIVHQTGSAQHAQIASFYATSRINHCVQPFFDNMPELYAAARLTISRAGATTLAELACAGCPAILLPYPQAADNHQLANARIFEAAGAAIVVADQPNPATTAAQLAEVISALLTDQTRLASTSRSMRNLARPDAARDVVTVLQSLIARPINEK